MNLYNLYNEPEHLYGFEAVTKNQNTILDKVSNYLEGIGETDIAFALEDLMDTLSGIVDDEDYYDDSDLRHEIRYYMNKTFDNMPSNRAYFDAIQHISDYLLFFGGSA